VAQVRLRRAAWLADRRCSSRGDFRRGHRLDAVARTGAAPDRDRFDPDTCGPTRWNRHPHGDSGPRLAQALIRFARRSGAAIILVGHVTKTGQIAGPRVVEHMVDAVLSFEGEGSQQFGFCARSRPLRPHRRNRRVRDDGPGLREVSNPSELFLSERDLGSPGTAVFAGIEGTRPVLVELQALVAPTTRHPAPRGGGLGSEPAFDGAGGAGSPLRRQAVRLWTSI